MFVVVFFGRNTSWSSSWSSFSLLAEWMMLEDVSAKISLPISPPVHGRKAGFSVARVYIYRFIYIIYNHIRVSCLNGQPVLWTKCYVKCNIVCPVCVMHVVDVNVVCSRHSCKLRPHRDFLFCLLSLDYHFTVSYSITLTNVPHSPSSCPPST